MDSAISSWPAPAKINRFLHVVGRREDGYHDLQTVFQFISLQDTLSIELTDSGQIKRRRPTPGVAEQDDLIIRAARSLQSLTGCSSGAVLELDKKIPMGAGLGGGSSDAATTLIALNYLWNTGLTRAELIALGNQLGADIPVFIHGRSAWAEGTGERLTTLDLPESKFLLVVPPCHVETAKIFKHQRLTRDTPAKKIRAFRLDEVHNDLEPVVRMEYPVVDEVIKHLQPWGEPRMTGSGSGVFVEVSGAGVVEAIISSMPADWKSFSVSGVNKHPLANI